MTTENNMPRPVVMAIKPQYAEQIAAGTKTVELRRRLPVLLEGRQMFVYATAPVKAVIGAARIDRVLNLPVDSIWAAYRDVAGIGEADFRAYFQGCANGFVAVLKDAAPLPAPVPLETLKAHGFRPPQSWCYAAPAIAELLE